MSNEQLTTALLPMIKCLATLDLSDPETGNTLNREFPDDNARLQQVISLAKRGIEDNWLCYRENVGARFSRITKPNDDNFNFSIDAVLMSGQGAAHTHTKGEVSICIAMQGHPKFDDFDCTWAVYPPGSSHTPTVTGGSMLFIYFLPDGAVEWLA